MSNNIVQLVDKNGNNIFPVAGSMAGDSVTTAMLQDGAVTSDKIDSATQTYAEQRIGTWVNGKPIYRALLYGTLPSGGNNVLLGTLNNFGVPLNVYGFAKRAGYWTSMLGSYGSSIQSIVQIISTNGEVRAYYDSTFAGSDYNLYVEYVKTS